MNNLVKEEIFERQRNLGAFYTPNSVSDILCKWAIRGIADSILEPSFGGCGFLTSSVNRFKELGNESPSNQIYGCDVDPDSFQYLFDSQELTNSRLSKRFLLKDFLSTSRRHWERETFDVILGNPPYVAQRRLSEEQRQLGALILEENGLSSIGKANLWFYFLLHSFSFLKPGGRLAFILPSTALDSNFAIKLPEILQQNFRLSYAITIKERMFKHLGVKEKCLVLLCEGFGKKPSRQQRNNLHFRNCKDLLELRLLLDKPRELAKGKKFSRLSYGFSILNNSQKSSFELLQESSQSKALEEFFNIRIGAVSGDKNYFVLKESQCLAKGLSPEKFFTPVVSISSQLEGISLTSADIKNHLNLDIPCLLLNGDSSNFKSSIFRAYLDSYPSEKMASNQTFKKRPLWYSVPRFPAPDLFLPYMSQFGPRLVLNEAGVINTNNVHRVDIRADVHITGLKDVARISLMSTYSQLCAELYCRHYGSGVLKIEPGDAKNLRILYPDKLDLSQVSECLDNLDRSIRDSKLSEAYQIADEFIDSAIPSINYSSHLPSLIQALDRIRSIRC
tara:strand:- start:646 stop:2331 length:1686 start_codon:yes stop_codon:yes gene_type:complete